MLPEQRLAYITQAVRQHKYCSIQDLASKTGVSHATIRRDLTAMQEMGLVARSHGGVIRIAGLDSPPITFRIGVNSGEKMRLAHAASKLLFDDSVVFLDESTTTLHIIDQLPKYKNIKVVTNSMSVLQNLYKYKIQAYCLGGEFSRDTMSFYGREAENMVKRFGIDLKSCFCQRIVYFCNSRNAKINFVSSFLSFFYGFFLFFVKVFFNFLSYVNRIRNDRHLFSEQLELYPQTEPLVNQK